MVTIPISRAIVESWGSITDTLVMKKVAFKESDSSDTMDVNEKLLLIKLLRPSPKAISNRKLYKSALTLMFGGQDYVKYIMKSQKLVFKSYQ